MCIGVPHGVVLRLLLFSVMWVFIVSGSEAWAGAPRDFELKEGSELRIWITQEVGGVVQPPSIGQPPSVSALSGTVDAEKEGEFWTLTDIDMVAEDLTISFLYPMTELSFTNDANLVGLENDSILSLVQTACQQGCTDFAVNFGYTFGIRPPVSQPIVDPLELVMGLEPTMTGDVLRLSGVAADGFIAIFENAVVQPGPLPLWIELDMVLVEVPVEPTESFEIQPGSEIRIYETAVVNGEAQAPSPGQAPGATSALTGVAEANRDAALWSFSLVDLEAADTSILLSIGPTPIDVTDISLDMPFAEVPDADGVLQTVSQLNGFQTGDVLAIDETACAGCTDFAASVGFTIGLPFEIALIAPLLLDVTTDSSGTALSGEFSKGAALDLGTEIGIWIEGDIDLVAAPEPSQGMLACAALVTLGLLSRRGRRGGVSLPNRKSSSRA